MYIYVHFMRSLSDIFNQKSVGVGPLAKPTILEPQRGSRTPKYQNVRFPTGNLPRPVRTTALPLYQPFTKIKHCLCTVECKIGFSLSISCYDEVTAAGKAMRTPLLARVALMLMTVFRQQIGKSTARAGTNRVARIAKTLYQQDSGNTSICYYSGAIFAVAKRWRIERSFGKY